MASSSTYHPTNNNNNMTLSGHKFHEEMSKQLRMKRMIGKTDVRDDQDEMEKYIKRLNGVPASQAEERSPYSFIPPLLSSFQILRHTLQSHLIPHSSPSHFIVCSPSNRPFLHTQVLKSCKNPRDGVESTNPTVSIAIFPRYTLPSTRTPPPC
ncbi:hypothetical protein L1887_36890 [Cichorium endivia]|nr:hypothetical protein L1887_36890 [Cichorium endivia]